jgi:hypothetical protein
LQIIEEFLVQAYMTQFASPLLFKVMGYKTLFGMVLDLCQKVQEL